MKVNALFSLPVKLLRSENSFHKKNVDRMFAKAFIDDMFEICKMVDSEAATIISNDDKARAALGLAAAS